jgi:hypothetical protein
MISIRRVKRRDDEPQRFARAIKATIIHPSVALASTLLARAVRWSNSTGEIVNYRGVSIREYFQVVQYVPVPW